MEARRYRVGYWLTEKKFRRLHFEKFITLCRNAGIDLVKIDFDRPLDQQGPFSVILHKLTDQMTQKQDGTLSQIELFQCYTDLHPEVTVIDPVENVFRLLDRRHQYQDVKACDVLETSYRYFIPSFVELNSADVEENKQLLLENGITFPFVCKPSVSHICTTSAPSEKEEEMAIIFNNQGLVDITPPCVAQSFVNHNARLFKIFVVGQRHFIIQRPSIKNFYDCNHETIFFNSNDVSKSNSSCFLNQLDESDLMSHPLIEPDCKKMEHFVRGIQEKFGIELLGIDVIIENDTGRYAVIDINAFPGYDGVPEFFNALLQLIQEKVSLSSNLAAYKFSEIPSSLLPHLNADRINSDERVTKTDRNLGYQDTESNSASIRSDETMVPKKNCSFLPQNGNCYIYNSMPTLFTHPAYCVCYSNIAASSIGKNRDRIPMQNGIGLH